MRIDSAGQEGQAGWAESQVMGALLRNLQSSIKDCSRVRPPDYLKAKGKKGESKISELLVLEGALFRDNLSAKIPFRPRLRLNS